VYTGSVVLMLLWMTSKYLELAGDVWIVIVSMLCPSTLMLKVLV
jgi:hypothetical protein